MILSRVQGTEVIKTAQLSDPSNKFKVAEGEKKNSTYKAS